MDETDVETAAETAAETATGGPVRTGRVALVSMPWNIETFTSLQIATLKGHLVRQGIPTTSRHYHKDLLDYLGPDERHHVHEYGYGEHLFGALYYPDRRADFTAAINRRFDTPDLTPVLDTLDRFCEDVVRDLLATGAQLVGFTTTHVQVMSSIYIARRLKEERPGIKVVLGGLALFEQFSESLVRLYPEIDFIVNGEGEKALHRLAVAVLAGEDDGFERIGGLTWRTPDGTAHSSPKPAELVTLADSPAPDLDDYLTIHLAAERREIPQPKVCVESARACSWGKCTFCIESISSRGPYRSRPAGEVVDQIERLVADAKSVDIAFTDPDMSSRRDVFEEVVARGLDLRIDAEVSGLVDLPTLIAMKRAGLSTLQIGIESFAPENLRRFLKGVQLIHYVELMRWCSQLDLSLVYNIIVGAPFDTQQDVDIAVANMRKLFPLAPPVISEFVVSLGSPIFNDLDSYGIASLSPLPETACYPEEVRQAVGPLLSFHAGYAFETKGDRAPLDHSALIATVDEWWKLRDAGYRTTAYRGRGFVDVEYVVGKANRHVEVVDPAEVALLNAVAVEAKSLRTLTRETGRPEAELRYAADALGEAGLLFESDRKLLALPVFERIDLREHRPAREQRLDLPWLRADESRRALDLVAR
ncbi:radical SAM protein [Kitasatospora sp. NPDC004289]